MHTKIAAARPISPLLFVLFPPAPSSVRSHLLTLASSLELAIYVCQYSAVRSCLCSEREGKNKIKSPFCMETCTNFLENVSRAGPYLSSDKASGFQISSPFCLNFPYETAVYGKHCSQTASCACFPQKYSLKALQKTSQ